MTKITGSSSASAPPPTQPVSNPTVQQTKTKSPQAPQDQFVNPTQSTQTSAQRVLDGSATRPKTQLQRSLPTQTPTNGTAATNQSQPAAAREVPRATTSPATNGAAAPASTPNQSPLNQLTGQNPDLRTNQDLINHFYQQGGGNWDGAQNAAQQLGVNLNDLVRDRQGSIQGAAPAAPTTPNQPAQPPQTTQPPAAPNQPAGTQPAPNQPAGTQPAPEQPAGTQPAPNQPAGTQPAPNQPAANPPAPNQPANAGRVDPAASTEGMTEAQRYDHFRQLIEQNGGQFKTGPNERNIVSMRTQTDADVNGGQGRYDDRTVMLWTDAQGNPHVREYQSNTEPSARYRGRMGEDVNGDGRLDQGRLPAGYYEYRTGTSSSLGNVLRPTQNARVERDTNQDGLFNDNAFGNAGQSMLFHQGGNNMTGSAGCQTMSPAEYSRFWRDINSNGNPGNIGYTLINL